MSDSPLNLPRALGVLLICFAVQSANGGYVYCACMGPGLKCTLYARALSYELCQKELQQLGNCQFDYPSGFMPIDFQSEQTFYYASSYIPWSPYKPAFGTPLTVRFLVSTIRESRFSVF